MSPMDAAATELADRVRAFPTAEPGLEEKRMFGTRAFLLNGRILVGTRKEGVLLVRVTDERGTALLTEPGVEIAVMGAKAMGPSLARRGTHGDRRRRSADVVDRRRPGERRQRQP